MTSEVQVVQVKQIQQEVQVKKILVDAIVPYTGKQRKPSHFQPTKLLISKWYRTRKEFITSNAQAEEQSIKYHKPR